MEACAVVEELVPVEGFRVLLDSKVVGTAVSTDAAVELCDVDAVDELVCVPVVVIDVPISVTISVPRN